jgi:hypothetical protein
MSIRTGRRRPSSGVAAALSSLIVIVAAAATATQVEAHGLQRCKIADRSVSFIIANNWACEAGYVSGLEFEAVAPGETAYIDLYTAPRGASVKTLVTKAIKAHGLTSGGAPPRPTLGQASVAGRPATTYALHFRGVFNNAQAGEISDSIYALTSGGVPYVILYSGVGPWAVTDHAAFAAFLHSLRFT